MVYGMTDANEEEATIASSFYLKFIDLFERRKKWQAYE